MAKSKNVTVETTQPPFTFFFFPFFSNTVHVADRCQMTTMLEYIPGPPDGNVYSTKESSNWQFTYPSCAHTMTIWALEYNLACIAGATPGAQHIQSSDSRLQTTESQIPESRFQIQATTAIAPTCSGDRPPAACKDRGRPRASLCFKAMSCHPFVACKWPRPNLHWNRLFSTTRTTRWRDC